MKFIFDTDDYFFVYFPLPRNTTPTGNRTAETQMHAVDACFWLLPLTHALT